MHPYEYYVKEFNDELEKLNKLVSSVSDAQDLESENDKREFVLIFRQLMRIINKLETFTEFTYDDVGIEEQELANYRSVFLDFHDERTSKDKVSILDDIDFELELIRNEKINVDYILNLLKDLVPESPEYPHERKHILKIVNETEQLRSKIDLIQRFIDENLGRIDRNKVSVEEEFDSFMKSEKRKEFCTLVDEENLNEELFRKIIDDYEFREKFDDLLIEKSFKEKISLVPRIKKRDIIKDKIRKIFDRFSY